MKPIKSRLTAVLLLLLTTYASSTFSQRPEQPACVRVSYQFQVDSLKQSLASQGFILLKEASITMESEFEMPVAIQLEEGSRYHFIFLGDPASLEYQVTMFDWKERMVFCKKYQRETADGNIIDCSFEPAASKYHVFRPLQVSSEKPKGLCGYVLMFKKAPFLTADRGRRTGLKNVDR
jgi:hypothetical protein